VKVSVVIPSSNGARFLGPCLDALRAARLPAGVEMEAIIVDNGSTDDTPRVLAQRPWAKALIFPHAMGFARANNAARQSATGDVIAFLNNDTRVDAGWMERPVSILTTDPRVVGVGSKLLFMHAYIPVRFSLPIGTRLRVTGALLPGNLADKVRYSADARDGWVRDGSVVYVPLPVAGIDAALAADPVLRISGATGWTGTAGVQVGTAEIRMLSRVPGIVRVDPASRTVRLIQNAGNFINERLEGGDVASGEEDNPGRFQADEIVPAICGAAMFVRRSALDRVGWFPDYYAMYYEDVDLCLSLRSSGGFLVFSPSSVVHHYHTGTSRELSRAFIENVARSSLLFTSRYGSPAVLARTFFARLGHIRDELLHGRWHDAAGTRGFIRALPAIPRPVVARIRSSLEGGAKPADLIRAPRRAYVEMG